MAYFFIIHSKDVASIPQGYTYIYPLNCPLTSSVRLSVSYKLLKRLEVTLPCSTCCHLATAFVLQPLEFGLKGLD